MRQTLTRRQKIFVPGLATALVAAMTLGTAATAHAGETTFNGRIYADFTSKSNKDEGTGVKSTDTGTDTDVKRFYFQVGYKYDDIWSAHFTSDVGDKGSSRYDVFVKHAYLEAAFTKQATFRLGSADSPWIPFAEGVYNYRYLENTLIDRLKLGNSADWGVHFLGKSGTVAYAVSAVNGRGFSDPTRAKSPDFEARVSVEPVKGLVIGAGAYSGKLGKNVEGTDTFHTASRFDGLVGWTSSSFSVGVEYFKADDYNTITTRGVTDSADGLSAFFRVPVNPKLEIFGRYDTAKPSKDINKDLKDTYYNAGIQYSPYKLVNIAFAWKHEKVDAGNGGKINGVGSTVAGETGKSDEIGIWTQLKW